MVMQNGTFGSTVFGKILFGGSISVMQPVPPVPTSRTFPVSLTCACDEEAASYCVTTTDICNLAFEWGNKISPDSIATSSWSSTLSSLIILASNIINTKAQVLITGGTVGSDILLNNTITTASGLQFTETMLIKVVQFN